MTEIRLLSEPTNFAIVQLPGRAFPGVVFQGDSLDALVSDIREALDEVDESERAFALNEIIGRLEAIQSHYKAVLDREGIALPYNRMRNEKPTV